MSDEVYICSSLLLRILWWLPHLAKDPTPDFNNGLGNDFNSDVSKQIRLCNGLGASARNSQVTCTKHSCGVISFMSLGQPTVGLRRYGWNTSKEGSLPRITKKKMKNKVEEIQLANLASLGSLASNQSVAWYACEASLRKERDVRVNEWKTRMSVC